MGLFDAFGRALGGGAARARGAFRDIFDRHARAGRVREDHIEKSDGNDEAYEMHPTDLTVPHVVARTVGGKMAITWNERVCCRCRHWRYREGQAKIAREGFPFKDAPLHWGEFSPQPWDMGLCQEMDGRSLTHKFAHCERFRAADDVPVVPDGWEEREEVDRKAHEAGEAERGRLFFDRGRRDGGAQ